MVYVIQEQPGKNITAAMDYGKIVVLLAPGMQVGFSAGAASEELRVGLSNFCDTDYLLLMGDPVLIGLATAHAAAWNQGRVKFLKWDRQQSRYFPVEADIYRKEEFTNE